MGTITSNAFCLPVRTRMVPCKCEQYLSFIVRFPLTHTALVPVSTPFTEVKICQRRSFRTLLDTRIVGRFALETVLSITCSWWVLDVQWYRFI